MERGPDGAAASVRCPVVVVGDEEVLVHNDCAVHVALDHLPSAGSRTFDWSRMMRPSGSLYDEMAAGALPLTGRPYPWGVTPRGVEIGLRPWPRTGGRTLDIVFPDETRQVVNIG